MIRFLLELFPRSEFDPALALAAAIAVDQEGAKITKLDTPAHPTAATYWSDWGGTYDNLTTTKIAVFLSGYLDIVTTILDLVFLRRAYLRATDAVFIASGNYYPWQYPRWSTEIGVLEGYSTAVPDPDRPSLDRVNGDRYPVRLEVPSSPIRLSDIISGTALQNATFSFSLFNNDGKFDLTEDRNIFNTPVYILKSDVEKPGYDDFSIIRRGFVDDVSLNSTIFTVKTATLFRTLSEPVCRPITLDRFPDAGDNVDKMMPCAWGEVAIEPIQVADDDYLVCDPDYFTAVVAAYDGDGNLISPGDYTASGGVLRMGPLADVPATVIVQGKADNRIGQIVTTEMQEKSRILFIGGSWDSTEAAVYVAASPRINLAVDSGSMQELVTRCLKSDNAFLVEKSDGRLTLRKWGESYDTVQLAAWQITQPPEKTYMENKYFCSASRVLWTGGEYLDATREPEILQEYRKTQERTFGTDLAELADAEALAGSLLDRLGGRRDTFRVSLGGDCSGINLLDTVELDLVINGRRMSNATEWIVKEVDPAQDVIVIEAKS